MLLLSAVGLVLALRGTHARVEVRSAVRLLGWVVLFVLLVASAPLLMDLVGIFLAVAPDDAVAFVGRVASVAAAVLLGAVFTDAGEGRAGGVVGRRVPPLNAAMTWWAAHARPVAYLVVVAALVRTIAQVIADGSSGSSPFHGPQVDVATIAFAVGGLLGGTVLPLGLVQPWGRRWPRWMFPLGGRRVPRWFVVVPVGFLAGGMTLIFGTALVQFFLDPVGATASSDYPLVFWWVVLPAYFVWGLGLAVLVVAYWHETGCDSRPRRGT